MSKKSEFTLHSVPSSPCYLCWLAGGITLVASVVVGGMLYFGGTSGWYFAVLVGAGTSILWLLALLMRELDDQFHRRQAQRHACTMLQVPQDWWALHRHKAALVEAVLIGAPCSTSEKRNMPFGPNRQPAKPQAPVEWAAIHSGHLNGLDSAERERQLAILLARQWCERQAEPVVLQLLRCYWLGSLAAWEAFSEQMAKICPEVRLPAHPEPWQGIDSLYAIIDQLQGAPADARILCAGCQSSAIRQGNCLPAGEAALLWLFGQQGRLLFSRGKWLGTSIESLTLTQESAPQQNEQKASVPICVSFDEPEVIRPLDIGSSAEINCASFGLLDDVEAMVALTLDAVHAEHQGYSWPSASVHHTRILEVLKPNTPEAP